MICPQCRTRNPIGNKFCRECGGKLTAEGALESEEALRVEAERTQERVATLLAESLALMDQEKPDLALPLAEEAAGLLPDSTSAHALLATLYERTEQEAKAIAAMERVVALNPDSQADQEKLEQMRRGVHVASRHAPARRSEKVPVWMPVALAGAVCVLVLSIGLALLRREETREPALYRTAMTADGQNTPSSLPPPSADTAAAAAPDAAARPAAPVAPGAAGREDPFVPTGPRGSSTVRPARPVPQSTRAPMLPPPRAGSTAALPMPGRFRAPGGALPAPRAGRSARGAVRPAPVTPGMDNALTSAGMGGTERIVVRPPSAGTAGTAATTAAPPPNPSGYIRIQVGAPPPRTQSAPVETDPMLRAQSLQAAGRYADAITAYQQALRTAAGAARGDAYQGIALSQQRLGNRNAARNAYRQAIAFYESSGGRVGQQGIAACRAALEVLGDG